MLSVSYLQHGSIKLKRRKRKLQSICNIIENGSCPFFFFFSSFVWVVCGEGIICSPKSHQSLWTFFRFFCSFVTNETPKLRFDWCCVTLCILKVDLIEDLKVTKHTHVTTRKKKRLHFYIFRVCVFLASRHRAHRATHQIFTKKKKKWRRCRHSSLFTFFGRIFLSREHTLEWILIANNGDEKKKIMRRHKCLCSLLTNADQFQGKYVSIY